MLQDGLGALPDRARARRLSGARPRPSPYLAAYAAPGRPGQLAAFSTLRASVARVPAEALEHPERLSSGAEAVLVRLGLLVADPEAEQRRARELLAAVNRADRGVNLAVVLGLDCNFACPYCYEKAVRGASAMTAETARGVAAFAAGLLGPGKDRLRMDFYGGEPLLYRERLVEIAAAAKEMAEGKGARFRFSIVTNGSLLTRRTVEALLPFGYAGAKVTLDGPAACHDASRPLRSGRGSFRAIVTRLRETTGLAPVGIGGNYSEANWRAFPSLFDELAEAGLGPQTLGTVTFSPVVPAGGELSGACRSTSEPWVAEAAVALRGAALARGYRVPRITPTPCMADLSGAFTVDWDGSLYKCPALIGRPAYRVGSVREGAASDAAYHPPRWESEPECHACAYLPLCHGGCRYWKLERDGTMEGVDCQRGFWDRALPGLVAQDVGRRS